MAFGLATSAQGAMVGITPGLDNSIFSENTNSNALGNLFAGQNAQNRTRRALLQFDIAANIPAGALIQSVSLELYQLKHASASLVETFELYPVLSAWGEGTSSSTGGGGAAATTNDATWTHRLFSNSLWITPGGDVGAISGSGTIGIADDTSYAFNSQAGMVADVQNWLNSPSTNFGWLLRATNESNPSTAREFASGENLTASQRPTLLIEFTVVPEPGSLMLVGIAGLAASQNRRRRRT
jgi:PEP-CTERM motif